jgi:hypothetical protein
MLDTKYSRGHVMMQLGFGRRAECPYCTNRSRGCWHMTRAVTEDVRAPESFSW